MNRLGAVTMTMVLFLLAAQAGAEVQTITATHTYTLGDNDSRNDARQLCFLEAKRKVLEKAGVYIQSQTEVENLKLTKDKISSYSAALLSVEIVKEDFGSSNGQNVLALVVKADVDTADLRKRLEAIAGDKGLQDRLDAQHQQLQQLEERVRQLNARVVASPVDSAGTLRKERNVVFGDIQELENKKLAAIQAIDDKTSIIRKYIVRNMTQKEVREIAGQPRAIDHFAQYFLPGENSLGSFSHGLAVAENYGEVWVIYRDYLVVCVSYDKKCSQNLLRR